jgi:hypothetical protein
MHFQKSVRYSARARYVTGSSHSDADEDSRDMTSCKLPTFQTGQLIPSSRYKRMEVASASKTLVTTGISHVSEDLNIQDEYLSPPPQKKKPFTYKYLPTLIHPIGYVINGKNIKVLQ